jgi:hypothetical protein
MQSLDALHVLRALSGMVSELDAGGRAKRNEPLPLALDQMTPQDPELPFDQRLANAAKEAREQAKLLHPGPVRDALLEKAREFEAQISMNRSLNI